MTQDHNLFPTLAFKTSPDKETSSAIPTLAVAIEPQLNPTLQHRLIPALEAPVPALALKQTRPATFFLTPAYASNLPQSNLLQTVEPETNGPAITVLTSYFNARMVKTYSIDASGDLKCDAYGSEMNFTHRAHATSDIYGLAKLLTELSAKTDSILIRGQAVPGAHQPSRRLKEKFVEPAKGCSWLMLDFDNLPLPAGVDPLSSAAIEYAIGKLPDEFQSASYFYQFSASAGIVKPDGTPLKAGLNVHLFYCLSRPIPGDQLAAYLIDHCIETGFYEKTSDKGGNPMIRYGIDASVIKSSVQPHYVGAPIIGSGVRCTLPNENRQGLVAKEENSVAIPDLDANLIRRQKDAHARLMDERRREMGLIIAKAYTKVAGRVAVSRYFRNPAPNAVRLGRELDLEKTKQPIKGDFAEVKYLTLYFTDESSPGSYYVSKSDPAMARRHGDGGLTSLMSLSPSAHAFVRDELKWFSDIDYQCMQLDESGRLPSLDFAKARNSLIVAPTSSGKTFRFCEFARAHQSRIIFYAAQTIALTGQMNDDLRTAGVRVVHYKSFFGSGPLSPGVYVTTNESLKKFFEAAQRECVDFILVIDEAHMALDDFMDSNDKCRLFEQAIGRAKRTLFLTGTITSLQIKQLTSSIGHACGELTAANYAHYEFDPVNRYPLWWAHVDDLGRDFIGMLRHYQALKSRGEAIPRTIVIAPISKMRMFELALEYFGLLDDADIVSRMESTSNEIEAARISNKPILISSPLFALGLNFKHAPLRFWTYFENLPVDTSQIIQTLNRANRTEHPCEVRLYVGKVDDEPMWIPSELAEKMRIEGYFRDESSIDGVIDSHFLIDRNAYLQLRMCEKNTSKSLHALRSENSIQNYDIVTEWDDPFESSTEDADLFKDLGRTAMQSYEDDVLVHAEAHEVERTAVLLYELERIKKQRQVAYQDDDAPLPKEFNDRERGIVMAITGLTKDQVGKSAAINPSRLLRLFGCTVVFVSGRYPIEPYAEWLKVATEKTQALVALPLVLKRLRESELNGIQFSRAMRKKGLREAVLALATREKNYVRLNKQLEQMDKLHDESVNKAGKARRLEIDREMFEIAKEFLATIGVTFGKTKVNGRDRTDPDLPVVPAWDFDAMARRLEIKAESLKQMPPFPIEPAVEHVRWTGAAVSRDVCQTCVHCDPDLICARGRPVQHPWDDVEPVSTTCDAFKALPIRLRPAPPGTELPKENSENLGQHLPANPHE